MTADHAPKKRPASRPAEDGSDDVPDFVPVAGDHVLGGHREQIEQPAVEVPTRLGERLHAADTGIEVPD